MTAPDFSALDVLTLQLVRASVSLSAISSMTHVPYDTIRARADLSPSIKLALKLQHQRPTAARQRLDGLARCCGATIRANAPSTPSVEAAA